MNKTVIKSISILLVFYILLYKIFFYRIPTKKRKGLILNISELSGDFEVNKIIYGIDFDWYDFNIVNKIADEVIMLFDGYIYFPIKGTYNIMIEYDDGIELSIDGNKLNSYNKGIANIKVNIDKPKFKSFKLNFFERKNNAKLKVLWRTPEEKEYKKITEYYH